MTFTYDTPPAELLMLVVVFLVLVTLSLAVRAGPAAFGRLLQLGLQAHEMVRARACVAEDNLASLLAHLHTAKHNDNKDQYLPVHLKLNNYVTTHEY